MKLHYMQIHSILSRCASPQMTMERIVVESEKAGLETIGISDHIDSGCEEKLLENFVLRDNCVLQLILRLVARCHKRIPLLSRLETIQLRNSILS